LNYKIEKAAGEPPPGVDEWEGKVGHFKLEAPVVLFGSNDGGCDLRWAPQESRKT
jgi:hypothetical protein